MAETVPDEVLFAIFSNLRPAALAAVRGTSRRWYQVGGDQQLLRTCFQRTFGFVPLAGTLENHRAVGILDRFLELCREQGLKIDSRRLMAIRDATIRGLVRREALRFLVWNRGPEQLQLPVTTAPRDLPPFQYALMNGFSELLAELVALGAGPRDGVIRAAEDLPLPEIGAPAVLAQLRQVGIQIDPGVITCLIGCYLLFLNLHVNQACTIRVLPGGEVPCLDRPVPAGAKYSRLIIYALMDFYPPNYLPAGQLPFALVDICASGSRKLIRPFLNPVVVNDRAYLEQVVKTDRPSVVALFQSHGTTNDNLTYCLGLAHSYRRHAVAAYLRQQGYTTDVPAPLPCTCRTCRPCCR